MTLSMKCTMPALSEAKGLVNFSQMKLSISGKETKVQFKNVTHVVIQI